MANRCGMPALLVFSLACRLLVVALPAAALHTPRRTQQSPCCHPRAGGLFRPRPAPEVVNEPWKGRTPRLALPLCALLPRVRWRAFTCSSVVRGRGSLPVGDWGAAPMPALTCCRCRVVGLLVAQRLRRGRMPRGCAVAAAAVLATGSRCTRCARGLRGRAGLCGQAGKQKRWHTTFAKVLCLARHARTG